MSVIVQTNDAFQRQLEFQAEEAAFRRQQLFEMGRQCRGTSNSLGDVHLDQGEVHVIASLAQGLMLSVAAICLAAGKTEASQMWNSFASGVVPQASKWWLQGKDRELQVLGFQLKAYEQEREERRNDTQRQQEERIIQQAMELSRLFASLFKLGQ